MPCPGEMITRAGIIGAGPCGLFMALLLARQGIETDVFERRVVPNPHPRAMGITRRTAEIFLQCGLLRELEKGAMDTRNCDLARWCRSLAGEDLGRVPIPELASHESPCRPLHVPQIYTEHVLLQALKSEARVRLHWGCPVEGLEQNENRMVIRLADGRYEEFDWVVAADGASSSMRKALGLGTIGPGDMGHFINVFFRAALGERMPGRRAILHNVFGGEFFEFFVAVNGRDLWLMHHYLEPGEKPEEFSSERACELVRRASGFPDLEPEILGISPWVMSPSVARSWRVGRAFLTGDASARLSPAGGLGLNTGLQSAWNLAWKLGEVAAARACKSLLDTYELERKSWAVRLMNATNQNAEEIFAAVAAAVAKDWQRVKDIAKSSRRHTPDSALDLGGRYEAGAFVAEPGGDASPGAVPGARAPHVEMDGGRSLLEFFGSGFVLLAGREGQGWKQARGVQVLVNGEDFCADSFEVAYGIGAGGAALVRPDGVTGARFLQFCGSAEADKAMEKILKPTIPLPEAVV